MYAQIILRTAFHPVFLPQELACMASCIGCSSLVHKTVNIYTTLYDYNVAPCAPQDAILLLPLPSTVIYTSCPVNVLEASGISKQDMCDPLCTLAGCTSDSSCTINNNCTCVSFEVAITALITIPLTICIVDPCCIPVCLMITPESDFSRTVCDNIVFEIRQTVNLGSLQLPVVASIDVRLVHTSPSKVKMTVSCIQQCIAIYNTKYY